MAEDKEVTIKYSESSGRIHQLMIRVTASQISIQSFLLWFPIKIYQVPPSTTVNIFFGCFVDGYVTTSLYICLLEVSVNDILSQVYNNAGKCTLTYTHTHIHIHPHTYIKFFIQYNIVVNW